MNLIIVTPPSVEPVELDPDVYDHLRLDVSDDVPRTHTLDAMLLRHVRTARGEAERITRRAFVQQTLRLIGPSFTRCGRGIELLRPPIISITSVSYYDTDNVLQTVDADDYYITDDFSPQLRFVNTYSVPGRYARSDDLRIDYVAGYPPDGSPPDYAANVPSEIKDAILLGVQLLYDPLEPREREAIEHARESLLSGFVVNMI